MRLITVNDLTRLHLPRARKAQELRVEIIQGKPLGRVRFRTPPVKLKIGTLYEEKIPFLVLEGSTVDVILVRTWIVLHSPEIRWDSFEVTRWSEYCHQHCLSVLPKLLGRSLTAQIASTSIESPASLETPSIPPDYAAFQDVFSKQAATKYHITSHGTVP